MPTEELEEHKQLVTDIEMDYLSGNARHWGAGEVARILFAEIDRLNAELVEARLTAEEAWDAVDEKEAA